jgi:hypothetical protein
MISSKKLLTELKKQVTLHDNDRKGFVVTDEETFGGTHEGNFARYRVRPSEIEAWRTIWFLPTA